jgi:hypothetical protein
MLTWVVLGLTVLCVLLSLNAYRRTRRPANLLIAGLFGAAAVVQALTLVLRSQP